MNFEMTGRLSISKETEKFKPWEEKTYDSGWVKRRLLFNVTCGDNRHMLSVDDGSFSDGHGDVYTFSKATVDESGNKKKGESMIIPFKERLTSPKIAEVAEFKKYIFDLEKPGRRYSLEKASERLKEGRNLTDEELKDLGLENESEIAEALEKSKKKRHEFITKWDFAEFIKKVIDSGKYSNSKFFIRGNGEYKYSENKERVYESYVPTRIYLVADDAEESSTATVNILFNSESLDTMSAEEKKKCYVNGWMMEYDNNRRGNIPVPVTVTIPLVADDADQKAKRRVESLKHKFTVDDESINEYGVVVNMLNGAQKTEITEDMLTDEQRYDLDCGLITMDDIREELGTNVYGERIREYELVKPARGFTKGRQETVYTAEDMVIRPIEETLPEGTEDLFDDDDDL
jgi:hypothetical protein|nr:MAG TPA: hypothetical protein [Caudoviricetes sp.]